MCVNRGVDSSCHRSTAITDVCATTSDTVWVLDIQSVVLAPVWQMFYPLRYLPCPFWEDFCLCIVFSFFLSYFLVFCFLMAYRNTIATNSIFSFNVINCVLHLHSDFLNKYILSLWRKTVSLFINYIHFLVETNPSVVRNNHLNNVGSIDLFRSFNLLNKPIEINFKSC